MVNRALLLIPALLVVAGCSEIVFTDSDEGSTRELRQGSSFAVSLPADASRAAGEPRVEGAYIRYLGKSVQGDPGRNVYRFSAEGVGEADIRIPPDGSNPGASAAYVIRVRINRISESHRDLQSQPPPQSRY